MTDAVILAAGYGNNGNGGSKLLEQLPDGTSIIVRVVKNVREVHGIGKIIMVVNSKYNLAIQQAIEQAGIYGVEYVIQPERRGAADAFYTALPSLREDLASDALVVFGDMPLISSKLMTDMIAKHEETGAKLTISTWPFDPHHHVAPLMRNYAFLIRDCGIPYLVDHEEGGFQLPNGLPEGFVSMYNGMSPRAGDHVLSSVYVVETTWFGDVFDHIDPMDKGDGYPAERHMPKLIELAIIDSIPTTNLVCQDIACEIIGVDAHTPESFLVVQSLVF